MEKLTLTYLIELYTQEKGAGKFRMDYVENDVFPLLKKFLNKEVSNLEELRIATGPLIWDTRNNTVIKKVLEHFLNVKLSGVVKRDKPVLEAYLAA